MKSDPRYDTTSTKSRNVPYFTAAGIMVSLGAILTNEVEIPVQVTRAPEDVAAQASHTCATGHKPTEASVILQQNWDGTQNTVTLPCAEVQNTKDFTSRVVRKANAHCDRISPSMTTIEGSQVSCGIIAR